MIVTGEVSGDLHGAKLINAVKALAPDTGFFGVGGSNMAAAGCEILIPGEELAVMGIVEILGHFPLIWRSFQRLKKIMTGSRRPDALVLIDFPEFNLRLARQAKAAGIPVLYYVSPQVWAWRRGRVRKIAEVVDSLAAIFPFEPELYRGHDILVKYVGHPLLDEFNRLDAGPPDLCLRLGIPENGKVVGIFPGSRRNELRYMLTTLVASAQHMLERQPDLHFLVPIADGLSQQEISSQFPADFPVSFIEPGSATIYEVAGSCDAVLSVSGTVTLQVALVGTPMAILYKMSPITFAIGKRLVRVDHIGLPNIVAGRRVVPELIQDEASPERLSAEILRILDDADYAAKMRDGLSTVQARLGSPGCSDRVAGMLFELLQGGQTEKLPSKRDAEVKDR